MTTASSRPDNSFFDEFLDDFYAESDEHLTSIRRNLLALEPFVGQPRVDRALLEELFRSFHSLKGLAGMVGLADVERLAHETESYFRALREERLRVDGRALDTLFDGARALERVLAASRARQPGPPIEPVLAALVALSAANVAPSVERVALQSADAAPSPERAAGQRWRFEFLPAPALAERGVNVNTVRARLEAIGAIQEAKPLIRPGGGIAFAFVVATAAPETTFQPWAGDGLSWSREQPVEPAPALAAAPSAGPVAVAPATLVRVDLARLDALLQLIGDLVITRSRLTERLQQVRAAIDEEAWREIGDVSAALGRQLRDLREGVVRARMVPLGDVFARMQFAARDIARDLGKQLRLQQSGEQTEIDKYIVERLADPLLHLVRNAVGHGLEPPDERVAVGKPAAGLLELTATTQGDSVTIELADDGRGVDAAQVAARARALGHAVADGPLDDDQLLELLCIPGFSTRDEADRISGRGVGMDVVRQTVTELGGTLAMATTLGEGTRFTLQLPLTLTIVDALIVAVGGERFAVPLSAVQEAVELEPAAITALEKNELLHHRDQVVPLVRLRAVFGLAAGADGYALLVQGGKPIALAVDRLLDKREIVVRALADPLLQVTGVGGATELGDGRVVLILDAAGLVQLAQRNRRAMSRGAPDAGRTNPTMPTSPTADETYILFELAGATYGIPSSEVLHIDMVDQVTPMPNASPVVDGVVLVRGQLVPLVSLRARFGFPRRPYDLRTRVIVIRHAGRQVGLLVDAAREFVRIPADALRTPPPAIAELSGDYLGAIATLGERLVLMVKLDEVLTLTAGLHPPATADDE